jgi:hypothetical protein
MQPSLEARRCKRGVRRINHVEKQSQDILTPFWSGVSVLIDLGNLSGRICESCRELTDRIVSW